MLFKVEIKRRIIVDLSMHFISTVIVTAIIYKISDNLVYAGIFILGGILIDLDHFVDCYICFKKRIKLTDIFGCRSLQSGKVYIFLHSWELIIVILIIALTIKSYGFFIFFLSLSLHLFIDNVQRKNHLFYFLTYRFYKEFKADILLPEFKDEF